MICHPGKLQLIIELIVIYICGPLLYFTGILKTSFIPLLLFISICSVIIMKRDKRFDFYKVFSLPKKYDELKNIFLIFIPLALLIVGYMFIFKREDLFRFPVENTKVWFSVLIFYPLISVIPQGILFRSFFFYRYSSLIKNKNFKIILNAILFSFAHIFFKNHMAILLTFIGGWLFAWRYTRTGKFFHTCFEHALYGLWVFTSGMGEYLVQSF